MSIPRFRILEGEEGRILHKLASRTDYRMDVIEVAEPSIRHKLEVDIQGIADFLLKMPPLLCIRSNRKIATCLGIDFGRCLMNIESVRRNSFTLSMAFIRSGTAVHLAA